MKIQFVILGRWLILLDTYWTCGLVWSSHWKPFRAFWHYTWETGHWRGNRLQMGLRCLLVHGVLRRWAESRFLLWVSCSPGPEVSEGAIGKAGPLVLIQRLSAWTQSFSQGWPRKAWWRDRCQGGPPQPGSQFLEPDASCVLTYHPASGIRSGKIWYNGRTLLLGFPVWNFDYEKNLVIWLKPEDDPG